MAASSNTSEHGDKATRSDSNLSPLIMFAAKTIVVVSACTTALLVLTSHVSNNVLDVVDRTWGSFGVGGTQFWNGVEGALDKLADPDKGLTREGQARVLIKLRAVSDKWRPFLAEAYEIVSQPAPAKPPSKQP